MGRAFLGAGDPGSAAAYFRDAISADPRDAESYVLLASVYTDRGSRNDALDVLLAGLRARPDHAPLWLALARAHEEGGDLGRAAEAMHEYVARMPRDPLAHLARAELARRRSAWSEALAAYRRIVDLSAEGVEVSAETLDDAKRYARALVVLVRESDPVTGEDRCTTPIRRALASCDE